jgi:folate-dependent phosphoribosylglycinamide formyltransferase PurN/peptidoglycan/xylan/chitin deacetylase (PgdA/CDA1 family)
MAGNPLKVVIFTSVPPRQVNRIMARLRRDAPEAQVVGVLYERRPPKTLQQRMAIWRKKMKRIVYWRYVLHRMAMKVESFVSGLLDAVIRSIHAAPRWPNGKPGYGLDDLAKACKASGTELLVTRDIHSNDALDFVRRLNADLGLVFGTRILKPVLFQIPAQGSINIHKRKVPDYRGGGAVGLWELLDDQKEIGVTVHRVEEKVDVGGVIRSSLIPIEPLDDLESLALKADVVGADLIVAAIRDFANGTVTEIPQTGPSKLFRSPTAEDLLQMKKKLAARRKGDGNPFRRPAYKLLIKSLVYAVPVTLRNWGHRRKQDYPVMILYHHLVSDRPHIFGASTVYFLRQVNYMMRHYRVVSLSEAVELVRKGGVKVPTVAITFDDGYADNFVNLRAVTEETGLPIGYFISTEHITSGHVFDHDKLRNENGFPPNTWEQIAFLQHCGYQIGSHTRNHADCGSTDAEFLRQEIVGSGEDIRQRLGQTPNFSFPFGLPVNISAPAVEIACANYQNVFSAYRGGNYHADARRMLRRGNFSHTLWELELQLQSVLTSAEKEQPHLKARIDPQNSTQASSDVA